MAFCKYVSSDGLAPWLTFLKVAIGPAMLKPMDLLVVLQIVSVCTSSSRKAPFASELFSVDFVNNNPSAFRDAYFDFAWLNVYQ